MIHTAFGLSKISSGLPVRKFINQTLMAMAIAKGLDGAFVNPLYETMMANITATKTLIGRDDFFTNHLKAYRARQFDV